MANPKRPPSREVRRLREELRRLMERWDAVIRRVQAAPGMFDEGGWLTVGVYGHQPGAGERYISTGSLYLCTTAFLPLGLSPDDPFWSDPDTAWTSRAVWSGQDFQPDHAI